MLASCNFVIVVAVLCFHINLSESRSYYDWTQDSHIPKYPSEFGTEVADWTHDSHIPKYPSEFETEGKPYLKLSHIKKKKNTHSGAQVADWTPDSPIPNYPYPYGFGTDSKFYSEAQPSDELKCNARSKRSPCIGDILQHFFGGNKRPESIVFYGTSAPTQPQQSAPAPRPAPAPAPAPAAQAAQAAPATKTEAPKAEVANTLQVEETAR